MEDGTLPLERPWDDKSPAERAAAEDEERRLCYVGMTRAKQRLTLSLARRRMSYGEGGPIYRGMEPSRFLADLPPELFGLKAGRPGRPPPRRRAARWSAATPAPCPATRTSRWTSEAGRRARRARRRAAPRPPAPAGRAAGPREPTVDYDFDQRPEAGAARSPAATRWSTTRSARGWCWPATAPGATPR